MGPSPLADLVAVLQSDPDVDHSSLQTKTARTLSIGIDVVRMVWRGGLACAVAADANLHTTLGALLDVVTLADNLDDAGLRPVTTNSGHVLIHRASDPHAEVDQALRSLRAALSGIDAQLWYRDADDWVEDFSHPPRWPSDPRVRGWVKELLLPRLEVQPGPLALQLLAAVDDPSLQLYPSEISASDDQTWSLRLDGLQIGTLRANSGVLRIGRRGTTGAGSQRAEFRKVLGVDELNISLEPARPPTLDVAGAAERVHKLLRFWRGNRAAVRGAPIAHRARRGIPIIDEHTVEARLLNGLVKLGPYGGEGLIRDDEGVARGSQFPTLWGHDARPRYLDALLAEHRTPIAVELKVATGGQGRYYRRALLQAVLYRHFIRNADDLQPWFDAAKLDRHETRAVVALPAPDRTTQRWTTDLERLQRLGERFDVAVVVVDDRKTPDWTIHDHGPEPTSAEIERLTWELVAAVSRRWPERLGRVVEVHRAGGLYDEIQLQPTADDGVTGPSKHVRVSLNRPGSLWIWAPDGTARWVWRGIWKHLAAGGDMDQAAAVIGAMVGLAPPAAASSSTFGVLAAAFLGAVRDPDSWEWRCAWHTGDAGEGEAPGIEGFARVLKRYGRRSSPEAIPTIGRIWCAIREGQAELLIDQRSLRVWVATPAGIEELAPMDPLERIKAAATLTNGYEQPPMT